MSETRICKGPLHREGKQLPLDSFPSERSKWCRNCMRDYDQHRGRSRGASRASTKETKTNPTTNSTTMAKQAELHIVGKGAERVSIPEVDKLVDLYVMARDKRMSLTEKEVEAKTKLIESLHKHKDSIGMTKEMISGVEIEIIKYRHDDLIVTLKHGKDELKVKTEEADENEK